ncbi:hypothetical protein [Streptomyces orinoci]|uniref:Integral membrane protein n=1 Tax=Streptomyces orinoci TaxID=67339 RepID=A0ABV3K0C2_STRON|nr:hypothetical protein [Streptomyces orinoci]
MAVMHGNSARIGRSSRFAAPGPPEAGLELTAAGAEALSEARRARRDRSGRPRLSGLWQSLLTLVAVLVVAAGVLRIAPAAGRAVGAPAASGTVPALTAGTGAALLGYAAGLLGSLPAAELATRARHGSRAGQGAALLGIRGIALVAQTVARAGRGRARFSPGVPAGGAWLVLPWRDAVALLHRPARTAAAVVWPAAGVLLLHLMRQWGNSPHHAAVSAPQAALFGWVLVMPLYLAASALSEGARQDTDNLTRTRLLPFAPRTVPLSHFAVPTAVLCVLGPAVAWATARLAGLPGADWQLWALVSTVGAPAAVGAALMTAYRGGMRYDLLYGSLDWYAVLPFLIWYTAPTLLCTIVAGPLLWQSVVSPQASLTPAVVQPAVAAALALGLSVRRVGAQARSLTR